MDLFFILLILNINVDFGNSFSKDTYNYFQANYEVTEKNATTSILEVSNVYSEEQLKHRYFEDRTIVLATNSNGNNKTLSSGAVILAAIGFVPLSILYLISKLIFRK
ncbi:hypothetical protein [Nostoc sp. FACHB-190]|uniref:hypothetical protein n=1 Tax=Nostoc sp. FACHB-190 TaxID=2692838 RepID=UPI0016846C21|nr:hypothetical protein [Nostoc sp. FACHB-190]MBD2303173.1 hypothetical protein [Nostoc sp. FACHB-190]